MAKKKRKQSSGADKHFDITLGLQVVESSPLVSVLFRDAFSHPTNGFSVTSFHTPWVEPHVPTLHRECYRTL